MSNCLNSVQLGVLTRGQASLVSTLLSVLLGSHVPGHIRLLFEQGPTALLTDFYWARAMDLARLNGVKVEVVFGSGEGVRVGRDKLMQACQTPHLWMLDDDVLVTPDCLASFMLAVTEVTTNHAPLECPRYFAGAKVDVANLRGYPDWTTQIRTGFPNRVSSDLNHRYSDQIRLCPATSFLDTGNSFYIHPRKFIERGLRFDLLNNQSKDGGEDALYARQAAFFELPGFFVKRALVWHLEKPAPVFTAGKDREAIIERDYALWLSQRIPVVLTNH